MKEITQYREHPLTVEEFRKLETTAARFMTVKEKLMGKSMPVADHAGEIYRYEHQLVSTGAEVFFKGEPDERVLESIMRPATRQAIAMHLTNLTLHKAYARGKEGFQIVVEDIIHDLNGCSEWALIKSCESFRLQRGNKFFPDTADLVHAVRNLDESVRWAYAARPSAKSMPVMQIEEKHLEKTDEGRASVANTLHCAGIPHDKTFCQKCCTSDEFSLTREDADEK